MQHSTATVRASDGTELFVNSWLPSGQPAAVVQIAHGMAEHSARYARFAEALTAAGYAVHASDHRGHGGTAGSVEAQGHMSDHQGFDVAVDDLHTVNGWIREQHPGLPVFLLGHSMGSFLSRAYAVRHGSGLAGLVLSGTATDPGLLGRVGSVVAGLEARVRGRGARSALMTTLSFGEYNKAFKPNRTDFDWLSRDEAEVDAYIADPYCGATFSAGHWQDLLGGLMWVNRDDTVARIPQDLPIHLVAGAVDPVGGEKAGEVVAAQLRRAGIRDVSTTWWPGARHEILNETNRDEVTADIVAWLDAHRPA